MNRYIEVVDIESGEVVQSSDVTGRTDKYVDTCERGMLRNMDRDKYFTRVVERVK